MWPSWYHCHSLSLASVKSRLVFTFLVLAHPGSSRKGLLNVCVCVLPVWFTSTGGRTLFDVSLWLAASAITTVLAMGWTHVPMSNGCTNGLFSTWRRGTRWRGRARFGGVTWWVSCCCYESVLMQRTVLQQRQQVVSEFWRRAIFKVVEQTASPPHLSPPQWASPFWSFYSDELPLRTSLQTRAAASFAANTIWWNSMGEPQKLPLPPGVRAPMLYIVPSANPSPQPKTASRSTQPFL